MVNIPYVIESSGFTHLKGGRTARYCTSHPSMDLSSAGQRWSEPQTPNFLSHLSESQAPIFLSHLHPLSSTRCAVAARRESLTLQLLPKPTFSRSHLLTCRQAIFKGRKYFLLEPLPCLPAPEKCPGVSGSKPQLHQTAPVFSGYSQGCHLPWLLQFCPQWFYKMKVLQSSEIFIHQLLEADLSCTFQHRHLAGELPTGSHSSEGRSLFPICCFRAALMTAGH